MPVLKFVKVISCSSESEPNVAANLLKTKKWVCKAGETRAEVVLQLEGKAKINSLNIGNAHSAFIEVQVGNSSDGALTNADKFETLLMATKFMAEKDARNSEKTNQVKCFMTSEMEEKVLRREWDLVKVICTQIFNKHVEYGINFVTLHGKLVDGEKVKEKVVQETSSVISPGKMFGRFKMREESPEEDEPKGVGIMARWKQKLASNTPVELPPKDLKPPDRNRSSLLYNKADEDDKKFEKSKKKIEKHEESKKKPEKKPISQEKTPKPKNFNEFLSKSPKKSEDKKRHRSPVPSTSSSKTPESHKKRKTSNLFGDSPPFPSTSSKRQMSPDVVFEPNSPEPAPSSPPPKRIKTPSKKKEQKPFNKLLEGITIVISGIQNPERADIRSKALAMGARYSGDWNSTCTHLICAFKNTPKYREVQGKGKIVDKDFILDAHFHRRRFPWRRYALEGRERRKDESEDEIHELVTKEKLETNLALYDLDYLEPSTTKPASNGSKKLPENPYDVSTDEEQNSQQSAEKPKFFNGKKFYLHPSLKETDFIKIEHAIPDNGGEIRTNLDGVDFIISENPLNLSTDAEIVKARWVFECLEMECFIPTKRYKF